jgi:hypothetical protein
MTSRLNGFKPALSPQNHDFKALFQSDFELMNIEISMLSRPDPPAQSGPPP